LWTLQNTVYTGTKNIVVLLRLSQVILPEKILLNILYIFRMIKILDQGNKKLTS
jgi:hypothetical protein